MRVIKKTTRVEELIDSLKEMPKDAYVFLYPGDWVDNPGIIIRTNPESEGLILIELEHD